MTKIHILGYPRIGAQRELKFALEAYWANKITKQELSEVGSQLRQDNWKNQDQAGLTWVTVGDFAWYDHVLNTSLLVGNTPSRHAAIEDPLERMFAIARGVSSSCCAAGASDMTKWFNTNYHYIVPELSNATEFELQWTQLFDEIEEAQSLGYQVKPVLLGPLSYLYLAKSNDGVNPIDLLAKLAPVYRQIFEKLEALGIEWLQIDEPIASLELEQPWKEAFASFYSQSPATLKLLFTTYFEGIENNIEWIKSLLIDGLHLDLVSNPKQLDSIVEQLPEQWILSAGIINGRNVWKNNLNNSLQLLNHTYEKLKQRLWIGSSCSLLHSPVDLDQESQLDRDVRDTFSFAKQKLNELALLASGLQNIGDSRDQILKQSTALLALRSKRAAINPRVRERSAKLDQHSAQRPESYAKRHAIQQQALNLPLLPTTTIGSFPQTPDIRNARQQWKRGDLSQDGYQDQMEQHIKEVIAFQEEIGLDVLVHGEAERNDMVEYFAQHLQGLAITQYAWVQSYGSRCVKPAIVVGDIYRDKDLSVYWSRYAQSLSTKPVKGMLTGPITMLAWTFPRDDLAAKEVATQFALAISDEVEALQNAGIQIIQVDEPALRELLPLRRSKQDHYLNWAVTAFRLSVAQARSETQIHTHMCYSEFNEIIESIAALDADVITIEASRSKMDILNAFEDFNYPNSIGPGVYDIHSPSVPQANAMSELIEQASRYIPLERLWINPDCGLKTRAWPETKSALKHMVDAAISVRQQQLVTTN
ncbi:5-methyltetrahydropteroyltriglutamate--homocysteine S-methyltransferase [Alginatibacterium sediminis]|uniref:5-methyltetrahydropteroyltriglutamate--homocysteine methyltransferase n=1 Tax=Alginatibacterium sediminis TaxID=2164068 RepID=A0A420EDW3_9ALTE|nr:5-methyltetrahydropteroyltriglutamate--homocysteine S-methyltransferase [Alginatibacterium sediminis]RKF18822.1 5-methyltetrahydropteroyltriglutamate--homocysteine S-methyltransferase [Alginatibacterium sediminis]